MKFLIHLIFDFLIIFTSYSILFSKIAGEKEQPREIIINTDEMCKNTEKLINEKEISDLRFKIKNLEDIKAFCVDNYNADSCKIVRDSFMLP